MFDDLITPKKELKEIKTESPAHDEMWSTDSAWTIFDTPAQEDVWGVGALK